MHNTDANLCMSFVIGVSILSDHNGVDLDQDQSSLEASITITSRAFSNNTGKSYINMSICSKSSVYYGPRLQTILETRVVFPCIKQKLE